MAMGVANVVFVSMYNSSDSSTSVKYSFFLVVVLILDSYILSMKYDKGSFFALNFYLCSINQSCMHAFTIA